MSAGPLLASATLVALLVLLGSRFSGLLAAPSDGALYRAGIYFMAGSVVLHAVLTLLDFARVPWSLPVLGVVLAAIGGLAHRFLPRAERARLPSDWGWGDGLALFALAAFTAFALTGWIAMPDFMYHWGIKGHRFYLAHGIDYPYLARSWNWVVHPEYPNLVPETFAVTAMLAGRFDMPAMMLGTAALFALLLAAVREGLLQGGADRFTRQAGLAAVALSATAFAFGSIMAGAADWNLTLVLAAALPVLLRPPDRASDWQVCVLAAFAAASKVEGAALGGILAAVQIVRHLARLWRERQLELRGVVGTGLRVGALPAAVVAVWVGRALHHHLFQPYNSGPFVASRAGVIFRAVLEALPSPAWHGLLPAIFLPPFLLLSRRTRTFAVVATLEFLFYFYVYFTAQVGDYRYFVLSNFARLGFQVIPPCLTALLIAWPTKGKGGDSSPPSTEAALGRRLSSP